MTEIDLKIYTARLLEPTDHMSLLGTDRQAYATALETLYSISLELDDIGQMRKVLEGCFCRPTKKDD